MTKKSAKKRTQGVPKTSTEQSNNLYTKRKGRSKRKQHARRMKEIMKHVIMTSPLEEEESTEDVETPNAVPQGEEGQDLLVEDMDRGSDD